MRGEDDQLRAMLEAGMKTPAMILAPFRLIETRDEGEEIGAVLNRYTYRSWRTDRAQTRGLVEIARGQSNDALNK
jgi:hypothetical protein